MDQEIAVVTYPGIVSWESFEFTDCAGVAPARGMATIYPQGNSPAIEGDIVIRQGSGKANRVVIKKCRIDSAFFEANSGGQTVQVRFFDERWKWISGYVIHGLYNIRTGDNQVVPKREKTPAELMELLCEAMDTESIDFSLMESDPDISSARPAVNWDVSNPAAEVQKLLDSFGLRLVPQRSTGKFVVCRTGDGGKLPENIPYQDPSQGVDPKEVPEAAQVFGAPVLYQCRLRLEAIGLELGDDSGAIPESWKKLIDLSYTPEFQTSSTGGERLQSLSSDDIRFFSKDGIGYFKTWIMTTEGDNCSRVRLPRSDGSMSSPYDLTQQYVFRTYRIKPDEDGKVQVPG